MTKGLLYHLLELMLERHAAHTPHSDLKYKASIFSSTLTKDEADHMNLIRLTAVTHKLQYINYYPVYTRHTLGQVEQDMLS